MNNASNVIAVPSVRQLEFLKYVPAVMTFDIEMNNPDIPSMEKALSYFVRRHESVRTVFPLINGKTMQLVLPYDDKRFFLQQIDVSNSDKTYWDIRAVYYKAAEVQFAGKTEGPLVKFHLFKLPQDKYVFLLLIDHIICDAWSMAKIIREEVMMFYNNYLAGKEPVLQPLKVQLRDYCEQQERWLEEKREALSGFWKTKLSGYDNRCDVNSYYTRYFLRNKKPVTAKANFRIKTEKQFFKLYEHPESYLYTFKISGQRFNHIKRMAEVNKCTISSVIYASLYIFLYCYTGRNKILMAAFIADRFAPSHRFIIGLLVGTVYFPREISDHVVIRDFIGETLYDVLTNCENIIFSHDQLALDEKKLNLSFDVLVNYIRNNTNTPEIPELDQEHVAILGSPYILESMIHEYDDSFVFYWKYKPLFNKNLVEDMVEYYNNILDFIAENSGKKIGDVRKHFNHSEQLVFS